jgi:hypothetical protein
MTPDERIDRLEKKLATAVEEIAVLKYQLVNYEMVERMAFMSYFRTHPEGRADFRRIDEIIDPIGEKQSDEP